MEVIRRSHYVGEEMHCSAGTQNGKEQTKHNRNLIKAFRNIYSKFKETLTLSVRISFYFDHQTCVSFLFEQSYKIILDCNKRKKIITNFSNASKWQTLEEPEL